MLVDDLQAMQDMVAEVEEQAVHMRHDFIQDGTLERDFPVPYLTWTEIEDTLPRGRTVELGLPGTGDDETGDRQEPHPWRSVSPPDRASPAA